jgi:hypothetical protein
MNDEHSGGCVTFRSFLSVDIDFADGALCNWNIADRHFPGAIQIVDLYHARQHLWELAGKLFPSSESCRKGWATRMQGKLDQGEIEPLVVSLRRL